MSSKTNTILDKHIKEDKLHELKASEITKVKQEGELYAGMGCFSLVALFFLLVAVVAWVIWSTKFTLFVMIVMGMITVPVVYLTFGIHKQWKKSIKTISERVNNL